MRIAMHLLLSLTFSPAIVFGQQAKDLTPELKVLDRFTGSWDETLVLKQPAVRPAGMTLKSSSKRTWGLNNGWIEHRGIWEHDQSEFLFLLSCDADGHGSTVYRQYHFEGKSPKLAGEYQGKWDAEKNVLSFTSKGQNGRQTELTYFFTDDPDKYRYTIVLKDRSGEVDRVIEVQCVRR